LPVLFLAGFVRTRDALFSIALRIPNTLLRWILGCLQLEGRASKVEAARLLYSAWISGGTDRFFSRRLEACPFCGCRRLVRHLETPHLFPRNPAPFLLDRCQTSATL